MLYKKQRIYTLSILLLLLCISNVKSQDVTTPANDANNGSPDQPPSAPTDAPTTTTPAPLVNPNVAEYLNRRIKQVLRDNPPRNAAELNLAGVFNDKLALLESALIREPAQMDDDLRAEQALENFRNFLQQYNDVAGRLENAIDDLTQIEGDANLSTEQRYQALMLLIRLRDSSSIRDAEKALRMYEDFRQSLTNGAAKPDTPNPETNTPVPPLNDEYRRYLEEILKILRKHYNADDPKMQNILQQLLKNPEQLKKLAAALKDLSYEDCEDEDYFWNLFSFW